MFKRIFFIILFIFLITNSFSNETNFLIKNHHSNWQQLFDWKRTSPDCVSNCTSIWYTVYRNYIKDSHGRIRFCFVFQSDSKYPNGQIANTGLVDLNIFVNNRHIKNIPFLIVGKGTEKSAHGIVYFNLHPSEVPMNYTFHFSASNTFLN